MTFRTVHLTRKFREWTEKISVLRGRDNLQDVLRFMVPFEDADFEVQPPAVAHAHPDLDGVILLVILEDDGSATVIGGKKMSRRFVPNLLPFTHSWEAYPETLPIDDRVKWLNAQTDEAREMKNDAFDASKKLWRIEIEKRLGYLRNLRTVLNLEANRPNAESVRRAKEKAQRLGTRREHGDTVRWLYDRLEESFRVSDDTGRFVLGLIEELKNHKNCPDPDKWGGLDQPKEQVDG